MPVNFEAVFSLRRANQHLDLVIALMPNPFAIEEDLLPEILSTLAMAKRELDEAEDADAAVTATFEVEAGERELDVQTTRSALLLYFGMASGFGAGDTAAGAAMIEECIALAPAPFANAHYALAIMYGDSGRPADGLKEVRKAIELDPDNEDYWELLSVIENDCAT